MQEYISACPHHGMEDWLLIQNFYHGLVPLDRSHLDAIAGGAFFFAKCCRCKDTDQEDGLQPRME